jgi:hypothetical protein
VYGDARTLAASRVLSPVTAGAASGSSMAAKTVVPAAAAVAAPFKANPVYARPVEMSYEPSPTPYYTVPTYFAPPTLRPGAAGFAGVVRVC